MTKTKNKSHGKIAHGWKPECLALDFDNTSLSKVMQEVERLQKTYELGDADIYLSSPPKEKEEHGSRHVYFFQDQKLNRDKEIKIIKAANHVDEEFKDFQQDLPKTRMRVKGKHKTEIKHEVKKESPHHGHGHPAKARHLKRTFEQMKKKGE